MFRNSENVDKGLNKKKIVRKPNVKMCFISGTKAFIKKKLEKSNIIRKIATIQ